ncbi:DNA adenine methylase [Pseudoalteromonas sp.]|uniref:DNA adenine methylase n=1 Tax=Pseudoalteromonas sp. TaxID=53249 RepID=UPI00257D6AF1|nr:DNA adenine methylase [Pseudoalteromonas sp.]
MGSRKPGLLKWPGGKERELAILKDFFPKEIHNYYEPFVGGGSVYLNVEAKHYYINDLYDELYSLYVLSLSGNTLFKDRLHGLNKLWSDVTTFFNSNYLIFDDFYSARHDDDVDIKGFSKTITDLFTNECLTLNHSYLIDICVEPRKIIEKTLCDKTKRIIRHELTKGRLSRDDLCQNFKSALKSAVYTYIRAIYNHFRLNKPTEEHEVALYIACFYFIRNYCYSSMFRFNAKGEFNVPYGGISYNENYLDKKINYIYQDAHKEKYAVTTVSNLDFSDFMGNQKFSENDFIFLDPPYDTEFSDYAQNTFNKDDQQRLANTLLDTEAKWLLVTKYTEFIESLYDRPGINIEKFSKRYAVSFKNRNDQDAQHLVITNY